MGMLVVYWPLRPRSIETPTKTDSGHDKAAATPTVLTQVVCYNRRRAVLLQLQVEPCKNLGAGFFWAFGKDLGIMLVMWSL